MLLTLLLWASLKYPVEYSRDGREREERTGFHWQGRRWGGYPATSTSSPLTRPLPAVVFFLLQTVLTTSIASKNRSVHDGDKTIVGTHSKNKLPMLFFKIGKLYVLRRTAKITFIMYEHFKKDHIQPKEETHVRLQKKTKRAWVS